MHHKYSTHKHSNTLTDLSLVKLFKGTLGKIISLLVSNFALYPSLVPLCVFLFYCVCVCVRVCVCARELIRMMEHLVRLKSKFKFKFQGYSGFPICRTQAKTHKHIYLYMHMHAHMHTNITQLSVSYLAKY